MKSNLLSTREWGERIILALLFLALGSLIIIVFGPLRPLLDKVPDYLGRIGLIVLLLVAVVLASKRKRFVKYRQVLLGLLILAIAVSLDYIFSIYVVAYLGLNGSTPTGFALQKLNECVVVVVAIIVFTRMSGGNLGGIYIQKGNLKLGLTIGLAAFFIAAAGSIPMAALFKTQNLSLARILPWLPWLLISVLANATQEELAFRGLFLGKLQPFFGKLFSNLLIVVVFTLLHQSVTYTSDTSLFLAIVVLLAIAWGYVMQKTNSIWGSILFHAGTDLPVFLGIFSNFPGS